MWIPRRPEGREALAADSFLGVSWPLFSLFFRSFFALFSSCFKNPFFEIPVGSRAVLGSILGPQDGVSGVSWMPLGASWVPLGSLGPLGCLLDVSWCLLGASWVSLPASSVSLGVSWGLSGVSWMPLGASWGPLGCLLDSLGGPWGPLGCSWDIPWSPVLCFFV